LQSPAVDEKMQPNQLTEQPTGVLVGSKLWHIMTLFELAMM
jgi:hypothetical protein